VSDPEAPQSWTIRKVLDWTRARFEKGEIDSSRLTAELLLAHTLGVARVNLYMDLDRPLVASELGAFRALIQRRLAGEPTQYLTGHREFYGRRFAVDPRVFIPRPETELLVEAVLRSVAHDAPSRIVDLCTGSGCVAISIAAERPCAEVWATEASAQALEVARANAAALGVGARVHFLEGDLFAPLPPGIRFDLIASNPPYVQSAAIATLQREIHHEPKAALDGGDDGLDVIRRIVLRAGEVLSPGGRLALEIGDDQGDALMALLTQAGFRDVQIEKDLSRLDRLALATSPLAPE
jgi:release factor glutamine methyltransferase